MWEPRRLTTLWASTPSYRDGVIFFFLLSASIGAEISVVFATKICKNTLRISASLPITREPRNRFILHFILTSCAEVCRYNPILVKIGPQRTFAWRPTCFSACISSLSCYILCRIDPLLGNGAVNTPLQRQSYCWKRCFLYGPWRVVMLKTIGAIQLVVSWELSSAREAMKIGSECRKLKNLHC
jgi:hypothetical protein